jgi:hypothetical protein
LIKFFIIFWLIMDSIKEALSRQKKFCDCAFERHTPHVLDYFGAGSLRFPPQVVAEMAADSLQPRKQSIRTLK